MIFSKILFNKVNFKDKIINNHKKKLLIYAHYYYPDVASTSQILQELAEKMIDTFNVTVICAVPSYTGIIQDKYKVYKYYIEIINNVKVIRVSVPEFSKTNKVSRIKNIFTYFMRALYVTFKIDTQDYIYTISQPPILGGILGVIGKWINWRNGIMCKLIYNIQDFNPEQVMAVDYSKNKILLRVMMGFDKFSCKIADKIIIVGRDMQETLQNRFHGFPPTYCVINNWINEKEIYPLLSDDEKVLAFKRKYNLENKFIFMYSGNIGLYYDLENIMRVIKKFKDIEDIAFTFVGEGSIKEKLVFYKKRNNLNNVFFIPYQDKADLIYSLNAGDIHWCVNAKGMKGISVPSKLYGIMAVGKPIIAVLEKGSEARMIIEETLCGYVTEPGNYREIENIIQFFINEKDSIILEKMSKAGNEYLVKNLTKELSIKRYVDEIKSC